MKFSTPLIFGALTALATAAPTPESSLDIDGTLIPHEAIISGLTIPKDVLPVFNHENNSTTVVFLNSTILAEAKTSNAESKRDLNAVEDDLRKREAEAEANPWHWVALKIGQPFFKRDADADADAWHWVALKIGQPFFKRSAEPWHWVALKIGQPFF